MPVELRNIKGGGINYVAYHKHYSEITNPPRPNSSELVLSTTEPIRKDSSKIPEDLQSVTITTISTMKEYICHYLGLCRSLTIIFQPVL